MVKHRLAWFGQARQGLARQSKDFQNAKTTATHRNLARDAQTSLAS